MKEIVVAAVAYGVGMGIWRSHGDWGMISVTLGVGAAALLLVYLISCANRAASNYAAKRNARLTD